MVMCRSPKRRFSTWPGDPVYDRGEDYVRYVPGLGITDVKAYDHVTPLGRTQRSEMRCATSP